MSPTGSTTAPRPTSSGTIGPSSTREPESLALLPLSDWQSGFFGAVGFDIGSGTISERGRITNSQAGEPDDGSCTQITEELLAETGNEEFADLLNGVYVRVCGPN